jgi:hypothetical protein
LNDSYDAVADNIVFLEKKQCTALERTQVKHSPKTGPTAKSASADTVIHLPASCIGPQRLLTGNQAIRAI